MSAQKIQKGTIYLVFISILGVIASCSSDSSEPGTGGGVSSNTDSSTLSSSSVPPVPPSSPSIGSSSSIAIGSSSSIATGSSSSVVAGSSSSTTDSQVCSEYQTSYCGGLAYGSVPSNSTTAPTTGNCLYIGDFEQIQPNLNSTVAINGVENTCGSEWGEEEGKCPFNTKPTAKDGGYYVYVKTGTINSYQNNGWKGIVAKAKPNCGSSSGSVAGSSNSVVATSSSSRATSSSSVAANSSSSSPATGAVSSSSGGGSSTCKVTNRAKRTLRYASQTSKNDRELDLTLPSSGSGPFPLVIFVHGGGFTSGSKADVNGTPFNNAPSKGYALASISHRLASSSQVGFPSGLEDILTAIRFLRSNANTDDFCLDPDKFAMTGFSAGGYHTGMVAVLSGATHDFDNYTLGYPNVSSAVQVAVSWSALTDFSKLDEEQKELGGSWMMSTHYGAGTSLSQYLGFTTTASNIPAKSNPLTYVSANTIPIMMQHGLSDNLVPWKQSELLVNKINSVAPNRAILDTIKDGGHGGFSGQDTKIFNFLDEKLGVKK